jgi:hypothetical protein
MKYYYRFTDKKKINTTTEQMATVKVYNLQDKLIGVYSWHKLIERFKDKQVLEMVDILIREHEVKQAFNKII